jgi:hypothetical protein
MPPRWGRSGKRATPSVDVRFDDGGALTLLQTGAWDELVVQWETEPDTDRVGSWRVEGEQVSFWLEHNGLKRDDVDWTLGASIVRRARGAARSGGAVTSP